MAKIEEVVDKIDNYNVDALPYRDIVRVKRSRYEDKFPQRAEVKHGSVNVLLVENPPFTSVRNELQSSKKPLVVTSINKSEATGDLCFGHEYVVDRVDDEAIYIHYTREGNGEVPIPSEVMKHLFLVRTALTSRVSALQRICTR